jgi:predicted TIM-barrel fold metal-dependent hydrolase
MEGQGVAKLEFFDCNTRIGKWTDSRPEHFTDAAGLLHAMDEAGIELALVHHSLAWQWDAAEGNRILLEEITNNRRLYPCFAALPPATREVDPDSLVKRCRDLNGAVRVFPRDHQWRLVPWCAEDLFAVLADEGVPLFVELEQTSWDDIAATAREFPQLPLVLLNTSYRADRYLYPLWDRGYNIMVSVETYMPFRGVEDVCSRFGSDRLLFGSGMPERDPGGPMGLLAYAQLSDEAKRNMAGANLARLLSITR